MTSAPISTSDNFTAICVDCPVGRFSNIPSTELSDAVDACKSCPPGFFSSSVGATECLLCPLGFYSPNVGEVECFQCPSGRTTPTEGAVDVSFCLSPVPNFSMAAFAFAIGCCLMLYYVSYGRYHRVAFLRKKKKCVKFYVGQIKVVSKKYLRKFKKVTKNFDRNDIDV